MMNDLQTGALLSGRYRIEEKLGEGGMAVVYRAQDLQRRVPVALKLLKPDYAEDSAFLQRFRREAANLKRLQHPNIVRFYEIKLDRDLAFMVLDFIEGPTLRKIMRQRGRSFTPGEALGYLRPICAALSYAHSLRVIHCDMKHANVMIDRAGRVLVNDFGIARISESATVTFSTPGTAAYMAPEQWRGGDDVYPATDVYAVGVMLYELLTGRLPFSGESIQTKGSMREKMMQEHLGWRPPPPSEWNADLPRDFDAILLRCLEKGHTARYQNADELVAEFEAACQKVGVAASPTMIPELSLVPNTLAQGAPREMELPVAAQQSRKRPLLAGMSSAGLLVVGGGIAVVAALAGLFAFGQTVAVAPTPTTTPSPIPTHTRTALPTASVTRAPTPTAADASPQIESTAISPKDGMVLVHIAAGDFRRGSSDQDIAKMLILCSSCDREALRDQGPQRRI
jgi:serine/threonine-protein kinase